MIVISAVTRGRMSSRCSALAEAKPRKMRGMPARARSGALVVKGRVVVRIAADEHVQLLDHGTVRRIDGGTTNTARARRAGERTRQRWLPLAAGQQTDEHIHRSTIVVDVVGRRMAAIKLQILIDAAPGRRLEQRRVVAVAAKMLYGRRHVRAYREPRYGNDATHERT